MNLSILWSVSGALIALAILPGTLELFFLTVASLFWKNAPAAETPSALNIAVVIPAHNEEHNIGPCIESLMACDSGTNRVQPVVVADNCTDDTAGKATVPGVHVLQRTDPEKQGKGHALSFAFIRLLKESFDAFIVLDADSLVEKNFILRFAALFHAGAMAVQCRYLPASTHHSLRARVMKIALLCFHIVRPRGRGRLGFSAGIFGNGFGLSREALELVPYHPSTIAEDLEYHISLTRKGVRVVFEDQTTVWSLFPGDESTATVQRSRWEGGRFRLMVNSIPALIGDLYRGKPSSLEALFDLLTLPLAFHVTLIVMAAIFSSGLFQGYAFWALGVVCFHVATAIIIAGNRKDIIALMVVPFYIIWKIIRLPIILKAAGKNTRWARTPRLKDRT